MKLLKNISNQNLTYLFLIILEIVGGVIYYFSNRPVLHLRDYTYAFVIALIALIVLDLSLKLFIYKVKGNLIEISKILTLTFIAGLFLLMSVVLTGNYIFQTFFGAFLLVGIIKVLNLNSVRLQILIAIFAILMIFLTGNILLLLLVVPSIIIKIIDHSLLVRFIFSKLFSKLKTKKESATSSKVVNKEAQSEVTKNSRNSNKHSSKKNKESRLNKPKHTKKK